MHLIKTTALIAALSILAGCAVDPHKAAERRADLMMKMFPDPANRQGLFMTFPLAEYAGTYRVLEMIWYPNEVSQSEVIRRVQRYCLRQNDPSLNGQIAITKDLGTDKVTLPDGQVKTVRQVFFRCLSPK